MSTVSRAQIFPILPACWAHKMTESVLMVHKIACLLGPPDPSVAAAGP